MGNFIYLLMVVMIDSNGNETLKRVNDTKYTSIFTCHIDKSVYKQSDLIKYECIREDRVKDRIK